MNDERVNQKEKKEKDRGKKGENLSTNYNKIKRKSNS